MKKDRPKIIADYLPKLSIFYLKQEGFLAQSGSGAISWRGNTGEVSFEATLNILVASWGSLRIHSRGNQGFVDQQFTLEPTRLFFGGQRYWFRCSRNKEDGTVCGRRVGVLYKLGDYWGCRHCYKLTYFSRRWSNDGFRVVARHRKLYDRIQGVKASVKRPYYRGLLTRKARELQRVHETYKKVSLQAEDFVNAYAEERGVTF